MSISISGVTRMYGAQKALNDVSFEIAAGEVVGFLGPNGAGKSTMMKIITGYLPQTSGIVKVCGLDVTDESLEYRNKIGYLPEHNPLYLDMYVKEYLKHVAGIYKLGKHATKCINEIIDITGLSPESTKKIGALSKGYRQRVGLAQALLPDPEVLILDEPTTGLDPNQIVEVRDLIKQVGEKKTIMLSTHIMQEVQAICERVIIINKGNLVANEKVSNLDALASGKGHTISIEFASAINSEELRAIEGVNSIESISGNLFKINADTDIRKELFAWTVAQNKQLLTLNQEHHSMEDIFRGLTQ